MEESKSEMPPVTNGPVDVASRPAGPLTLALALVAALAIGGLAYTSWMYLRIQDSLAASRASLSAAYDDLDGLKRELARLEVAAQAEPAPSPAEQALAEIGWLHAAWTEVEEAGMPRHEFVARLSDWDAVLFLSAFRHLERHATDGPDEHTLSPDGVVWQVLLSARLHHAGQLIDDAFARLEAAVAEAPAQWSAWLDVARLLAGADAADAATRALDRAVESAPTADAAERARALRDERLGGE